MRRRRSNRVTWFPTLGATFVQNTSSRITTLFFENLIPELATGLPVSQGNTSLFCIPITRDSTSQAAQGLSGGSLRDYVEGQDYVLKRIVGSIFVTQKGSAQTSSVAWQKTIITCGFLVARAEEVTQVAVDLDDVEVDPQGQDNVANPWIWRRSWMLGNNLSTSPGDGLTLPMNNMVYGAGMSGPYIDSKIARRITKEHRLWFAGSIIGLSDATLAVSGTKFQQPTVSVWADLRILGSMRRGKNLSTF